MTANLHSPALQELDAEFALVRSQLRGLDFRHRVGIIAKTIPNAGPASSSVAKGEDVMTIAPEIPGAKNVGWLSDEIRRLSGGGLWIPGVSQPLTEAQVAGLSCGEGTATVTLRGGHSIRGVPWSFLADPDGTNWSLRYAKRALVIFKEEPYETRERNPLVYACLRYASRHFRTTGVMWALSGCDRHPLGVIGAFRVVHVKTNGRALGLHHTTPYSSPEGVYQDKRGFGQRLRHSMQNWRSYQVRSREQLSTEDSESTK